MNFEQSYKNNYMGMPKVSHLDIKKNNESNSPKGDVIYLNDKENYMLSVSFSSDKTKNHNNFDQFAKSPQTEIPNHYYLFSPLRLLKGRIPESEMNNRLDDIAKKMKTDFATVKILALQYIDGINPDDDFDCSNL